MNLTGLTVPKLSPSFLNLGLVIVCLLLAVGGMVQAEESGTLISRALLKQAGLNPDWQICLPIKIEAKEKLDRLFVLDQYLLILTNQNYLFCRNRMDGSYRFEMPIAEKGLPVVDPLYIDNRVLFIVGSQLKVLDPAGGTIVRTEELAEVGENRNASIAKNDRFLYIAGVDRRVHAFQIQEDGDYVQLFTATADNDSALTSILAVQDRVFFATLAGNIIGMQPDKPIKVWQYNTSGTITAPLVLEDKSIYAGGHDTKLYKISTETGELLWETPFFAGDLILKAPELGETTLYLNAGNNGVYGISKETGQKIWNIPQGQSLLCEAGDRAYVYARPGVLMVMDNTTGKEVYSLNFSDVTRYTTNLQDSKMYLADTQGRVACISVP